MKKNFPEVDIDLYNVVVKKINSGKNNFNLV